MIMQCDDSVSLINMDRFINNELACRLILAAEMVEGTFEYFQIERKLSGRGCIPWDLKDMMKLIKGQFVPVIFKINRNQLLNS